MSAAYLACPGIQLDTNAQKYWLKLSSFPQIEFILTA